MRMIPNLQPIRDTMRDSPRRLEGCDAPDAVDRNLKQRHLTRRRPLRFLRHVHEPELDRRTPAVDYQNLHINLQTLDIWIFSGRSSCRFARCPPFRRRPSCFPKRRCTGRGQLRRYTSPGRKTLADRLSDCPAYRARLRWRDLAAPAHTKN